MFNTLLGYVLRIILAADVTSLFCLGEQIGPLAYCRFSLVEKGSPRVRILPRFCREDGTQF